MTQFDPSQYAQPIKALVERDRSRPLDAGGGGDVEIPVELTGLSAAGAFAGQTLVDSDMAACCLSGLWLLYDQLDTSHDFSQRVKTPSGSFWHGIMHRREGDYSNAKYWFRSVGDHGVYEPLAEAARSLAAEQDQTKGSTELIESLATPDWAPFAMVDACESAVRRGEPNHRLLVAIQRAEWELLFEYCYGRAVGQ